MFSPKCFQSFPVLSAGGLLGLPSTPRHSSQSSTEHFKLRSLHSSADPTTSLNLTTRNSVITAGTLPSSNILTSDKFVTLSRPHFNINQNFPYRFWSSGILCVDVHSHVLAHEMDTIENRPFFPVWSLFDSIAHRDIPSLSLLLPDGSAWSVAQDAYLGR